MPAHRNLATHPSHATCRPIYPQVLHFGGEAAGFLVLRAMQVKFIASIALYLVLLFAFATAV